MISYGGVPLSLVGGDLLARIEAALPTSEIRDFARRTFPGRLASLGMPWLARDWTPQLQTLCWPNTASRWAEGWFFAVDQQLGSVNLPGSIRAQAYAGGTWNALPLVVNDGTQSVTLSLYMLPPIPLCKVVAPGIAPPGLYLLPLVDARYLWWDVAASISVTAGTTTWTQLFASLASALGITLTTDAISSAYLSPPSDFNTNFEFLPPQLDGACRSVGLQLVANLDGTFKAVSAATAQTQLSLNLSLPNPVVAAGGGLIDLVNDATSDLAGVLPASVTCLFPTVDADNNPTGGTTPQTVTLASLLPPASVNLPQFVGAATFDGTELLRCSANAGPSNGAEIAALATQLAADWYSWQGVRRAHLSLSGAASWAPTGGEERIELYHGADTILTRIRRPPWNERDETGLLVQGSAGSTSGGGAGGNTTIIESVVVYNNDTITINESIVNYNNSTTTFTSDYFTYYYSTFVYNTSTFTFNNSTFTFNSSTVTFNSPVTFTGGLYLPETVNSAIATGVVNNYALATTNTIQDIVTTGDTTITGMISSSSAPMTNGLIYELVNTGTAPLTIANQNSGSTSVYQFLTPNGGPFVIQPGYSVPVKYDTSVNNWRLLVLPNLTTSGSGGTDPNTLSLTFGSGLTYTKGTGANLGMDSVSAGGGSSPTSGFANLTTDYTCTNSWANTGLSIVLPSAGNYLLIQNVLGEFETNSGLSATYVGNFILTQLVSSVLGGAIDYTGLAVLELQASNLDNNLYGPASKSMWYTATGADTISMRAKEDGPSHSASGVGMIATAKDVNPIHNGGSEADNGTSLAYIKFS
jgi:hypothetical protein